MTALNVEENIVQMSFKPGLNKILLRLENAGGAVSFGLMVHSAVAGHK